MTPPAPVVASGPGGAVCPSSVPCRPTARAYSSSGALAPADWRANTTSWTLSAVPVPFRAVRGLCDLHHTPVHGVGRIGLPRSPSLVVMRGLHFGEARRKSRTERPLVIGKPGDRDGARGVGGITRLRRWCGESRRAAPPGRHSTGEELGDHPRRRRAPRSIVEVPEQLRFIPQLTVRRFEEAGRRRTTALGVARGDGRCG